MSRVLITGGAGVLGAAVARRLLADPAYDVRIADESEAPQWMREACEIRSADLRVQAHAQATVKGCSHVIHIASFRPPHSRGPSLAHTQLEYENALHSAMVRASLERDVERFLYVSSPLVFERAELLPTPEDYLEQCPVALLPGGYSRLSGERYCRAAHEEHGFAFTICRPSATYGATPRAAGEPGVSETIAEAIDGSLAGQRPLKVGAAGERTMTPTHVDDAADGLIAALGSPAAVNEDFNLAGPRELSVAEIARVAWEACGGDLGELALAPHDGAERGPQRSVPAADKARELLGWQARIAFEDGVAATVRSLRAQAGGGGRIGDAL